MKKKKRRVPMGETKDDSSLDRAEHFSEEDSRTAEASRLQGARMNHGEEDRHEEDQTHEIVSPDNAFREAASSENSTLEP